MKKRLLLLAGILGITALVSKANAAVSNASERVSGSVKKGRVHKLDIRAFALEIALTLNIINDLGIPITAGNIQSQLQVDNGEGYTTILSTKNPIPSIYIPSNSSADLDEFMLVFPIGFENMLAIYNLIKKPTAKARLKSSLKVVGFTINVDYDLPISDLKAQFQPYLSVLGLNGLGNIHHQPLSLA